MNQVLKGLVLSLICVLSVSVAGCKKKKGDTGSSPTPTPSPSASPSPTERYPGLPGACQPLPNGTGGGSCAEATGNSDSSFVFMNIMRQGLTELIQQQPDLFEADGETVRQGKWDEYIRGYMAKMSTLGVCAVYDGYKMFARDQRNLSEVYEMQFRGRARAFTVERCAPARGMPAFYTSPPPHDPWCPLPNSKNTEGTCGGSNTWLSQVDSMMRELIAEEKVKGAASTILHTDQIRQGDEMGYYIKSIDLYFRRLIEKAHQRNLCAYANYFDSLFLKSPTGANAYSDVYDVVYHSPAGDVTMRSPGFTAKCSPAEF